MSLSCLTNYVGLKTCADAEAPSSGLYVNDLPGVSLRMVDSIANDDQQNYAGVWEVVQRRARQRFMTDVRGILSRRYMIKSLTGSMGLGRIIDAASTTAAAAQLRGLVLEMREQADDVVCSNLLQFYINSVSFYATAAADVVITVWDLDTGNQITTKTIAAASVTANAWNSTNLLVNTSSQRIFIAVNCAAFDTVLFDTTELDTAAWVYNCYLRVHGATAANGLTSYTDAQITQGTNGHGVSADVSAVCDFTAFVCRNMDMFKTAWWYLLGIELMSERLYSDSLNEFTLFDRSKAKELKAIYTAMYMGGTVDDITYYGELRTVLEGITLNTKDLCIDCDGQVSYMQGVSV